MVEIGGVGNHIANVPAATYTTTLKLVTALQLLCPLTASLSKLGVLCFLHRIFGTTSRRYRMVIRATFVLETAIMLIQFIIPFANCRPFSRMWIPWGPGSCTIPGLALWRYLGIPNVFTTLIMVLIPIPALLKLHISRPMKFGLAAVLFVCVVGIVAAIMRFQAFLAVDDFRDITYEGVPPLCWTIAESGIYLIAGTMLTLKALLKKVFKNTIFERLVTASSSKQSSWGNRRFSRLRAKQTPPVIHGQPSSENVESGRGGLPMKKMPQVSANVEQW